MRINKRIPILVIGGALTLAVGAFAPRAFAQAGGGGGGGGAAGGGEGAAGGAGAVGGGGADMAGSTGTGAAGGAGAMGGTSASGMGAAGTGAGTPSGYSVPGITNSNPPVRVGSGVSSNTSGVNNPNVPNP